MLAVLMALTLVGCSSNNNGGGQAPADNRSEVQKIIAEAQTMTLEEEKIMQECAREILGEAAVEKMEHCIGYDPKRVYWRHGKKYYKPWRNHFCAGGSDLEVWDGLKKQGFAESGTVKKVNFWLLKKPE